MSNHVGLVPTPFPEAGAGGSTGPVSVPAPGLTPERADFEPDPAPPPFGRGGNSSASKEARDPDSDIDSPGESEFRFSGPPSDLF